MATWVSWCDDGVTVVCDLEQCRDPGGFRWQTVVEPAGRPLTPKDLSRAIDEHERSHT
jgi:hypothetical protein